MPTGICNWQTGDLHSDGRIGLRVEIGPAAERLGTDGILADVAVPVLPQVQQQLSQRLCPKKVRARRNCQDVLLKALLVQLASLDVGVQ